MKRRNTLFLAVLGLFACTNGFAQTAPIKINAESSTKHGPERGSLIILGSGATPEVWEKFTELAGGKENANIVVITAATGDSAAYRTSAAESIKKRTGIKNVTILHTDDLKEANSEAFIEPLKKATGVFFSGGRQWRIADSYLNTLTHEAFFDVLNRGGVIAGGSAGATIQGSFLWRGDTKNNYILVGDHTQGLGFLKNSVIDQHLIKRNRQFDLVDFIRRTPELIGIGLDEGAGVLVQRDTLEVIGKSYVAIYDYHTITGQNASTEVSGYQSSGPFFFLSTGQKYDLSNRKVIQEPRGRRQPQEPTTGSNE